MSICIAGLWFLKQVVLKDSEMHRSSFYTVFFWKCIVCSLLVEGHTHSPLADYQLFGENTSIRTYAFSGYLPRTDVLIGNLIYPYQNCVFAFPPYEADMKAQIKLGVRDLSCNLQLRNAYIYELAKIMTRTLYIWDIPFHLYFKCSCVTVTSIRPGYIKLHVTGCTCHQLLQQNCGKTFWESRILTAKIKQIYRWNTGGGGKENFLPNSILCRNTRYCILSQVQIQEDHISYCRQLGTFRLHILLLISFREWLTHKS